MEGLIPFVYKAIMQYKSGKEGPIGSWICDSPSYSYMRLPGDSGRFQIQAPSFSAPSASPSSNNHATTQIIVSSSVQSPHQCLTHRRIAAST
uniref:Legume-specific protein n=1 Tax=Cajanus cajan TaxID=3821 RepID=A0A151THI9_CAJCA|nr:hypothetical protein KK1_012816 [Cajanus cajan]